MNSMRNNVIVLRTSADAVSIVAQGDEALVSAIYDDLVETGRTHPAIELYVNLETRKRRKGIWIRVEREGVDCPSVPSATIDKLVRLRG